MHFGEERPTVVEEPLNERLNLWDLAVNETFEEEQRVSPQ